jgi:DNA-binding transcriptional LysR family regulator
MDIRQLRYFLTIADEGSITKAAEKLHMSQPPLSQQLKLLETELGVQLFERNTRNITLTDVGEALLYRTRQILDLFELTKNEVMDIHAGLDGTLSIGTVSSAGATFLPNIMQRFHQMYPRVNFEILDEDSDKIMEMLTHGMIDLGIIRTPFAQNEFEHLTLPSVPFSIACENVFWELESEEIELSDLGDKPLIVQLRYEKDINTAFNVLGVKPKILCKSNDVRTILSWANSGLGVALVPSDCRFLLPISNLHYINLKDSFLNVGTAIIWSKKHYLKTIAKHFIKLFEAYG